MKTLLLFLALTLSLCTEAQIVLKGYKCKFYEGQWTDVMAEMYSKNDTFRSTFYGKDILETPGSDNPGTSLQLGLELCFDGKHYTKTKDSLYISTGKNYQDVYYYKVYVPDETLSVSVRAAKNDSLFSERSKWLLSQIRLHRKGLILRNDKGQNCLQPDHPEE